MVLISTSGCYKTDISGFVVQYSALLLISYSPELYTDFNLINVVLCRLKHLKLMDDNYLSDRVICEVYPLPEYCECKPYFFTKILCYSYKIV